MDRRLFLKMASVPLVAAALPPSIAKAVAIPASSRHGSIRDVEHVIFLMQENRSFDHYFGTMRGVRGYADPHPVRLPSGKPVWNQPDGVGEVLPFRPNVPDVGKMFLPDPPHGWSDTHAAWNGGKYDQWVPNKGVTTMTYHQRHDLPYQYALADAFTVCDNYHCSLLGPTDPNRYYMWTGWVGNDGKGGGPVISNAESGYDWMTYPERLQQAGISWKVYQDIGDGLDAAGFWGWTSDPFIGNYGDNSLLYFHQYQNAEPGNPLADRAKTGTDIKTVGRSPDALLKQFRSDVASGNLPQVSWIVTPEAYSEHPNWEPDYGAWYVSQVIDILASHPEVWSKMALFITYDEEGGHFDHLVPPTPAATLAQGKSNVPVTNEYFSGSATYPTTDYPAGPYGFGIRVPMLVVSPWSRGGWVNSQLFDHTSLIRFLERRFAGGNPALIEPNITPWRRAVSGDLTNAFDFAKPNTAPPNLPGTSSFKPTNLNRVPDQVPIPPLQQQVPGQEQGVRPARALPYTLFADGRPTSTGFRIDFSNQGDVAAVFQVRTADAAAPKTYTLDKGTRLSDVWDSTRGYDLEVHGPNGFFRGFRAGASSSGLAVRATYQQHPLAVTLLLTNPTGTDLPVSVSDAYSGKTTQLVVRAHSTQSKTWSLERHYGWYDLTVQVQGDATALSRVAGHVENGRPAISDPLMGGLLHDSPAQSTAEASTTSV